MSPGTDGDQQHAADVLCESDRHFRIVRRVDPDRDRRARKVGEDAMAARSRATRPLPGWRATCFLSHPMRTEPDVMLERPRSHSRRLAESDTGWLATLERSGRDVALVIADEPLTAAIGELYRAYGYDVLAPDTPLAAIQMMISTGDRIGVVVIFPDIRWAAGLHEFLADEYPEIERIVFAS